jgi:RsiW-degrading membrane proteinase PrsW (M82 family)
MSALLASLALAALPAALLLAYFYRLDRARPEPVGLIGKSVLYGFFAVIPAAAIEYAIAFLVPQPSGPLGLLFEAFLVAGLVEESVKLYFIRHYIFRRSEFDERVDGIIYAICVSLGFAFVENFVYGYRDWSILVVRSFTAVPGHALFSGIMGYYLGLAKLERGRPGLWKRGLAWAVVLHGVYDWLIMSGGALAFLVLPLIGIGLFTLRRLFARAEEMDRRDRG